MSSVGTWNPPLAQTGSVDMAWEAGIAAFAISGPGIASAASTADGAATAAHAWPTDAGATWAAVGLDVFP